MLRESGVFVTVMRGVEQIHIIIIVSRPTPRPLLSELRQEASIVRWYLACPQCQQRHSLAPSYGTCWPCSGLI